MATVISIAVIVMAILFPGNASFSQILWYLFYLKRSKKFEVKCYVVKNLIVSAVIFKNVTL